MGYAVQERENPQWDTDKDREQTSAVRNLLIDTMAHVNQHFRHHEPATLEEMFISLINQEEKGGAE